jgi:hypothetical protein
MDKRSDQEPVESGSERDQKSGAQRYGPIIIAVISVLVLVMLIVLES